MARIHPTAIVDDGARLGADVAIGAYSMVGREVVLGDGVEIDAHVIVRGRTTVGALTTIGSFSAIGGEPQDTSYRGEDTAVEIGARCSIREHVTIHRGTARGHGVTRVGADCLMMIASHVAHDCIVGNKVILTNQATLGGHVEVGDYAIVGGLSAVQQRCRLGAHCFIGGVSAATRDVVPFAMASGQRVELVGVNVRGLRRRGFDHETIHMLRSAQRAFFFGHGTREERIAVVEEEFGNVAAVGQFIDFLKAAANRPLALPRRHGNDTDEEP
jgi:UDP-N-acetylglucosamine acyltransferase